MSREDVRTTRSSWEADSVAYQERNRSQLNRWDRLGWGTWDIPEDIFFDCLPEFERWAVETLPAIRSTHARYELDVWTFS